MAGVDKQLRRVFNVKPTSANIKPTAATSNFVFRSERTLDTSAPFSANLTLSRRQSKKRMCRQSRRILFRKILR